MQTDPEKKNEQQSQDVELNDEQLESASGGAPTPSSSEEALKARPIGGYPR